MRGPNGLTIISPAVMRIISLERAQNGQKVALAAIKNQQTGNYDIFGQEITVVDSMNDKWRLIQLVDGKSDTFYIYHCETGLYLAKSPTSNVLTLVLKNHIQGVRLPIINSQYFGVWKRTNDERGIYLENIPHTLIPSASKKYCVAGNGINVKNIGKVCSTSTDCDAKKGEKCTEPMTFCINPETKKSKPNIFQNPASPAFGSNPYGGDVYPVIDTHTNRVYAGPPMFASVPETFCTGVVQTGDKSHNWYLLPQQDMSNISFTIPVRSAMSLGEFFSWDPSMDVNALFNVSQEPLRSRFVDESTQTVPTQSQYPQITAITQSPNAVDCLTQTTSNQMFLHTNTFNWQYIDIYANFGGDQGYAPEEFKHISIENMGLQGDFDKIGPGPLSGPDTNSGKFEPNTKSLYTYIDGKRAAGLGGRVGIPPKWMIDACHKNGVKCFGCIFFQEVYYGGKWGWWVQFCQDPELSAKKMADICAFYGFDGWLFNFETGPPDEPLQYNWPGQEYRGMNVFTAEKADEYWCNVLAGAKYPAWKHTDMECGSKTHWPCSCAAPEHGGSWPIPGFSPGHTNSNQCGTSADGYTQGCNTGWILRENMKKMIQMFNQYRDEHGIDAELMVYDTIQVTSPYGVGISTVDRTLCPTGITNQGQCYGNMDFWEDENGPVSDYVYSMRSGLGGMDPSCSPRGVTSTYILSRDNADNKWPKNTGPHAKGIYCPKALVSLQSCTSASQCGSNNMCDMSNTETGQSYCTPNLFTGYMCNDGKPPPYSQASSRRPRMKLGRPYDYYQALQLEDITPGNVGNNIDLETIGTFLAIITKRGNPQGWDSALYCGTQSHNLPNIGYGAASGDCINEEKASEKPLASLNLYYVDTFYRWFDSFTKIPGYPSMQAVVNWVIQNQLVFYTGARFLNPENRVEHGTCADYWKGLSHFVPERSVINNYPFYTCFCIGNGTDFWVHGSPQDFGEWNNWSFQTILPTWMWWVESCDLQDAPYMQVTFDIENAYERSNSLCFQSVADSTSWMRTQKISPGSCNVPNSRKSDCGIGDPTKCREAGCCWDNTVNPSEYPWCFHKAGGISPPPPLPTKTSLQCRYRLFKTKLSLERGCYVSVVYKGKQSPKSVLKLGVSFKSSPDTPSYFELPLGTDGSEWQNFSTFLSPSSETISVIWLWVRLPLDFSSQIRIGEISLSDRKAPRVDSFNISASYTYTTTETGETTTVLQWYPIESVEFYKVYTNQKLTSLAYQGTQPRAPDIPMTHSVMGINADSSITLVPVTNYGQLPKSIPLLSTLTFGFIWALLLVLSVLAYLKTKGRKWMILALAICLVPIFIVIAVKVKNRNIDRPISRGGHAKVSVAYWQNAKPHAFNACFDDSRVKCWRWIIHMWKKKKWPIKFTFFYNTLWLPRDWYTFKEWIGLGHEIACHGHDHICPCQTDFTKNSPNIKDAEQYIADNDAQCAKLIRKLYDEPDRELLLAWPHGAYPLINPKFPCTGQDCGAHNGTPRPKVIKMLQETFIAARGAPYTTFVNTWPNPASKSPYPNEYWPYAISPRWGWPYQIDINPGSDVHITELCAQYKNDFYKAISIPNGMCIVAGHDFAPMDVTGKDVPCNWASAPQFTDGPFKDGNWCSDMKNCQETFTCPSDVADITLGCWWNPGKPGPELPIWLYTDNDQSKGIYEPPLPPSKSLQLQPPPQPNSKGHGSGTKFCNQCCDACWDPVPGSCIVELFDEVAKNQELFWFATFTEIIQYTNNRQNVSLIFDHFKSSSTHQRFELNTGKMHKCDITLTLTRKPESVRVDDTHAVIGYESMNDLYYITFRPISNHKHMIDVYIS